MSAEGGGYSPCPAEALPELSAAELAMSLSPKSALLQQNLSQLQLQHSTPFSVTDILSPIEEYRKLELANNPPSPYRSNSSGSSINSPLGPAASCGMAANPYAVPLYGGAPVQGYGCAPADLPHYGDMRGASWYPASNDPRGPKITTQSLDLDLMCRDRNPELAYQATAVTTAPPDVKMRHQLSIRNLSCRKAQVHRSTLFVQANPGEATV
ncbi:unnamed protein product [Euphydryas editha]|uniref:Uncharacterized protein n=1 Tax=Euphydryas editha TaxID=104508 RepID=A0AAU9U7R6_EUPED|nr:unnamed protein product [Euphydryas editha]